MAESATVECDKFLQPDILAIPGVHLRVELVPRSRAGIRWHTTLEERVMMCSVTEEVFARVPADEE